MSDLITRAKEKANAFAEEKGLKTKAADLGDKAVQKVLGGVAGRVSDKTIPYLNRYDNTGFMEGSGYFLAEPDANAGWRVGFAKASIMPERVEGDLYLGGYLAFPPNRAAGILNDLLVRAFAFDDGSDRGVNVFAVIDCVGISNADIRRIREKLKPICEEKNIVSVNVSATHCHSGVDTLGVWGDLKQSLKKNPGAVKSSKKVKNAVSGKNPDFMEYLFETAAETIENAVNAMRPGKLHYALLDAENFVHDKRPPDVIDPYITVLRFTPDEADAKKIFAVLMGAHPTCYGDKQRQLSADFPYYICKRIEEAGYEAAFFQGAEAAIATDRGKFIHEPVSRHGGIVKYGEEVADYVLGAEESNYIKIEPLLNVRLEETFIPADNALMALLGKLKLVNNNLVKVTNGDDGKDYDLYFSTEIGLAEFGGTLKFALIPGELAPEIAYGGVPDETESYNHTAWKYPPLNEAVQGHLSVIGLCNDCISYILPDNDFGSVFAPLHYEESVSAGRRAGSNVAGAFLRTVQDAERIRIARKPAMEDIE